MSLQENSNKVMEMPTKNIPSQFTNGKCDGNFLLVISYGNNNKIKKEFMSTFLTCQSHLQKCQQKFHLRF